MGNKKNTLKRKNHGSERLAEWRILKQYNLVPERVKNNKKKKIETENCSITDAVVIN